ncbi:hypothetical protein ACFQGX_15115 [Nonomuraea dietziae]|uniref:hypothetical protein n=1 Tax=Nonomuraea dietziae TaxID=65515 RepID=UPI003606804E
MVNATTDYAAGLVSPLLLPRDLPLLVDDRLTGDEGFLFTPTGERRTALRLHSLDLLRSLPSRTIELPAEAREAVAVRH